LLCLHEVMGAEIGFSASTILPVLATWVIRSGFGNERASLCYLQMNMRPAENLLFLHYQQRLFRNEFSIPVFQGLFAFQAVAC